MFKFLDDIKDLKAFVESLDTDMKNAKELFLRLDGGYKSLDESLITVMKAINAHSEALKTLLKGTVDCDDVNNAVVDLKKGVEALRADVAAMKAALATTAPESPKSETTSTNPPPS